MTEPMTAAIAFAWGAATGCKCSGLATYPYAVLKTNMIAVTVTAATIEPAIRVSSMRFGVAPVQYPTLRIVIIEPVIESAVQTTPPINRTASIPLGPARPRLERTIAEMISVVSVIPEIGVVEIIAIAQAETAAKRKAMPSVRT